MKKNGRDITGIRKNLRGFESVLDLVSSDVEYKKRRMRELKNKGKNQEIRDFEYFNFLENELERLVALDCFFSNKIHNLNENSNLKFLIQEQNDKKDISKFELIEKLLEKDGSFIRRLSHLFDSSFN
ncbi:MAG: hypothetical protein H6622_09990 [Halobacteriovoraceae bacterium]|nr:hypothetical protein [Halobacteriovoraceae bacterium]